MTKPTSEQEIAAQGRELEAARWELPARFRLLEELLALPPDELRKRNPGMHRLWEQANEQQKAWQRAANEPFSQPSVQDVFRAQAAQHSAELALVIHRLQGELAKTITGTGEGDVTELQAAIHALKLRRADALAEIGRYDLAAVETPDEARREEYLNILDALTRPDDLSAEGGWCACPPHRGSGVNGDLEFSKQYVKKEIFSIVHGKVVFLLRCAGCKTLNAVPDLPQHIAQQRAHRQRAHQLAGKLSPEEAKRVLTGQNHTTKRLLGK